ncbi:MAG: hypothetical protein CMO35_09790 [Verrucomicrobiaceae bacterium]|nr:hypothetical protein [Verrucomicrobiaceae bacterium]
MTVAEAATGIRCAPVILCLLVMLSSCRDPGSATESSTPPPEQRADELFRVGSIVIHETDLTHHLKEHHGGRADEKTRQKALNDLVRRAQFAHEAIEAGLADDPVVNAEINRLLESRLRESRLNPLLKELPEVTEARLRELYQAQIKRFQSAETRQVAVLWLDSGPDPDKARRYKERLAGARKFALENRDIADHPEKGFSVLGADYSEHSASRFRGGLVGWMGREGNLDSWSKAVASIAFSLKEKGEISEVTIRREGVFLVRLVDRKPGVTRSFESVAASLKRAEQSRLRENIRQKFEEEILSRQGVEWTTGQ